jgi:hypothetical protein
MVWIFLVLGIALLLVGSLMAVLPTLRADRAHGHTQGVEEAWSIISQPLEATDELIRLPKDENVLRRLLGSRFLQGSIVGAGTSLVVAGVVLSYALVVPGGLSTAEAANPAPQTTAPAAPEQTKPNAPAPNQPNATAAATTPSTPKPSGTVAFEVKPGQVSQEIAANLKAAGLITAEEQFIQRLGERGVETRLQAGQFQIPQGAPLDKVIDILIGQ